VKELRIPLPVLDFGRRLGLDRWPGEALKVAQLEAARTVRVVLERGLAEGERLLYVLHGW
jgi:hypothetical protein